MASNPLLRYKNKTGRRVNNTIQNPPSSVEMYLFDEYIRQCYHSRHSAGSRANINLTTRGRFKNKIMSNASNLSKRISKKIMTYVENMFTAESISRIN